MSIYRYFDKVQALIEAVSRARKTLPAKEIKTKLEGIEAVSQYLSKENAVIVSIDGLKFRLDLSISASKNADSYYSKAKKAREKLQGARLAAEKTKAQIREYVKKGIAAAKTKEEMLLKKAPRKRRWYEGFRWFISTDGFLVIGGRDAASNEAVVKKHMDALDIFVHADIHGAPAVVVKAEGREVPAKTIEEACQFAASNSTAWKSNAAFLDAYWVKPEQVSKTPKPGEYVAKGAFIIRGTRNYTRAKIALSVGVRVNEEASVMCGPPDAVEKNCDYSVTVFPGPMKSKEASERIKESFLRMARIEHKDALKRLNVDEIQKALPTGGYHLSEGKP